VEQTFRTAKHLFSTRPIFHKLDETIRGHVFSSFLALVLKKALEDRIAAPEVSSRGPDHSIIQRPRLFLQRLNAQPSNLEHDRWVLEGIVRLEPFWP
jgi:hypothetical protein